MDALKNSYRASLESILGGWSAALAGVHGGGPGGLRLPAVRVLPKELVPPEDRGRVDVPSTGRKARATTTRSASA
jgi:multidrug efflux pump